MVASLAFPSGASAQEPPAVPAPSDAAPRQPHRFWDRTNVALFAGVAVSRGLDYASTRHFRARGDHEILLTDGIVDDKPLFVAIEALGAAASIGVSAWLHKKGRHGLERWLSVVHIGVTTFGAVRNYDLRPVHPPAS